MGGFGGAASGGALTPAQQRLLAYTRAHDGSAAYVFATTSWSTASPYILATGAKVLPIGGFSGRVPSPTENRFRHLVDSGTVRYVLLGGGGRGRGAGAGRGGTGDGTAAARITAWVEATCTKVPASAYGGPAATAGSPALSGPSAPTAATGQTLYLCEPAK
jgi:4-amino-4-deoxy-L-arabinose transferase-like glycosyltransferase